MGILGRITRTHILLALLVAATAISFAPPPVPAILRSSVQWAFAAGGDAGMYLTTFVKSRIGQQEVEQRITPDQLRDLQEDLEFYRRLTREQAENIRQLASELAQMRSLYGALTSLQFPCDLIEARVIATDSLPYGRYRSVNAGTNRGAEPGAMVVVKTPVSKALPPEDLAVLQQRGLVGRVVEAWAFGARVQLITDRGFSMSAQIRRLPEIPRTIILSETGQNIKLAEDSPLISVLMKGDGAEGVIVENVPGLHNIQPGDLIVTCDDRFFLPARVPIAKVEEVIPQVNEPGFVRIRASPMVDLDSLREVFIVYPRPSIEDRN